MPTKNPRINITFEDAAIELLQSLAVRENKSISSMAKELILDALERREDIALASLAKLRDTKNAKRVKHEDAWK